ncbi:hypothetical protein HPB50_009245 [Hyalomma asiaticum]|uniref:Uncharacterized protein n=1 Tax=Hyalomma asiaticum TaxID=266040 RepID=A0ACB7T8V2_HYAAI|nr:hypothetical protein HPB50_009245 [Hyalomma asiaticum]
MTSSRREAGLKRIACELEELLVKPPDQCTAGPIDAGNLYRWQATIAGPQGSPYEGGLFKLRILLPRECPFEAPVKLILCPEHFDLFFVFRVERGDIGRGGVGRGEEATPAQLLTCLRCWGTNARGPPAPSVLGAGKWRVSLPLGGGGGDAAFFPCPYVTDGAGGDGVLGSPVWAARGAPPLAPEVG